ncbi:hypothetical protein [Bradyrhizobium sp. BWA-3-5]|uniref:hypothetical protein n=1 Tax=Bradyrhizobium sp. BWA-3-5 TaxID=3080013 RepID=UPI00293F6E20|nr:hypothetical protein [Bradyrhizobium sp. BWA-3-5]WOH65023.1 hypothetical protein RX331_31425 [Bradyrhizobium sp. BWA-3-5]
MLYSQSPPLTAEETLDGLARDLDVRPDQRVGRRRTKPPTGSAYSYRFGEGRPESSRPSIGRRLFRSIVRFSIAVLIGVGATLGWQAYGDEAREILVTQAPVLAWVLPVPTTKSPIAVPYADPTRQLAPMASTLDAVRRSVEQLAAKQEQMAQNIAALRAAGEDVRQKTPAAPAAATATAAAPAQPAVSAPQPKPPQAKIDSRLPSPAGSQFSR